MNKNRLTLGYSFLVTVLASAVAFAAPPGTRPAAATPGHQVSSKAAAPKPGTGNFVQRLIGELRSKGLEVSVGYPMLYTQADCAYSYPVYHNCFGNNPAAPYVVPVVKSWPDEYVDPAMKNGMGRTRPGYSSTYRLDPKEAIIVFGKMPPPARYLGLQTWIWTTGGVSDYPPPPWDEGAYDHYESYAGELIQYLFATDPGSADRVQSLSSINNNINNVVMQKKSGSLPWDEIRYFVITPDQLTDDAVRQALWSLGVVENDVFTEEIPQSFEDPDHSYPYGQNSVVGPLGIGADAVDFFTAIRYSMPDNEHAANAWRRSLRLTVLRVRRVSGPDPSPYLGHDADPRSGNDESDLGDALWNLVDAVIDRAAPELTLAKDPEKMIDLLNDLGQFGPACREIGMNCLGDNQDASYFLFKPKPLDTGRIYAVVSTLATETDNATYVGLSVNDASLLKGVLNIPDTELKGSASSYTDVVPDPENSKFFVHFFTRDCDAIAGLTDGACTTVTKRMVPLAGDDKAPGDPDLHGMFSAAVRAYVAVGSERGPDPTLQLRPILITFTRDSQ